MKLRLRENSIRLRLLRGEIAALGDYGEISETITFAPGSAFVYTVRISEEDAGLTAVFEEGRITVRIPRDIASRWLSTDLVGIGEEQDAGGKTLTLLLEKDFACLDRVADEDSRDAFPHPKSNC
jgi:hypothetical protein